MAGQINWFKLYDYVIIGYPGRHTPAGCAPETEMGPHSCYSHDAFLPVGCHFSLTMLRVMLRIVMRAHRRRKVDLLYILGS